MMGDDEKVISDLVYMPVLLSEISLILDAFKQRADEIFEPGWRIIDFGYKPALVCDIYVWLRIKGRLKGVH